MIIRATLSLGLVWLLIPHHPDLGLSSAQTRLCSGYCEVATADSDAKRETIMARLRLIKVELEQARMQEATE
jgi:hypothetical protein